MAKTRGIRAGRAFVELFADDSKLVRGLHRASRRLRSFGKKVMGLGMRMAAASAAMATPFAAGIRAAKDAQETLNRFRAVFKDQADAAGKFADAIAREVGRSRYEIRDALATFQSFFVGLGFGGREARGMSEQLEQLALDFASFHNLADQEGMQRFISALSGSSEVLDRFGINIKQAALQQELLNMGIRKSWTEVTEQEKALARLNVIMRAMTDQGAVGDAVRTAGSFANRLKALKGELRDTAVAVGNALLPVVTPLLSKLVDAVKVVGDWVKRNKEAVVAIGKLVAVVGAAGVGLIVVGGTLASLGWTLSRIGMFIGAVGKGFALLKGAITSVLGLLPTLISLLAGMISPLGLVVAAAAALGAYLVISSGAGGKALAWLGDRFNSLKEEALRAFGGIKDALAAGDIKLAARVLWLTLKMEWQKGIKPLRLAWHKFTFLFKATFEEATHRIALGWLMLTYTLKRAWARFATWWKRTQTELSGWLAKRMLEVQGLFDETLDVEHAKRAVDESTGRELVGLDRERDARVQALKDEQAVAQRLAQQTHERRMGQIGEEYEERINATRAALRKTKKEWRDAIAEARRKRKEVAEEGAGPPGLEDLAGKLRTQIGALGDVMSKASVRGTFTATAVWGLGTGSAMDRTARATEQTAQHTRDTDRKLDELLSFG